MFRLLISTFLLLAISSCRIGNYVSQGPGPEAVVGNYETLVNATITMCSTRPVTQANGTTQDQTNCPVVPATHMDGNLSYVISNPVYFQYDSSHGIYWLGPNIEVDPKQSPFIPVFPGSNNSFAWNGPLPLAVSPMPSSHPDCMFGISANVVGNYSQGGTFSSGSDLPIRGRIAMDVSWSYVPDDISKCTDLTNCYNGTGCTTNEQSTIKSLFQPFIDIGILTASDLSKVEKLEYQASYH